jgi:hypothetical protein
VGGHIPQRQVQRHHRKWQRDDEDRAPVEACEERAREERAERGDRAPERRPKRNGLRAARARPERRDQGERRRVGHPRREPADQTRDEEHFDRGSEGGEQRHRDRQRRAQDQHQLASVAVAEGAEVEHRRGEPQRIPDGDQIERRLAGVERLADVRQCDVGDGQVEIGNGRNQDERDEDEARPRWRGRGLAGRRWGAI